MTKEQTGWLKAHPEFKSWRVRPIATLVGWADVGYVLPNGKFIVTGSGPAMSLWQSGDTRYVSTGDTLFAVPPDAHKVGREYAIC